MLVDYNHNFSKKKGKKSALEYLWSANKQSIYSLGWNNRHSSNHEYRLSEEKTKISATLCSGTTYASQNLIAFFKSAEVWYLYFCLWDEVNTLYAAKGLLWLMQLSLYASPACCRCKKHNPAELMPLQLSDQVYHPTVVRKQSAVSLSLMSYLLNRGPSWWFSDNRKLIRKFPAALVVGFAFTELKAPFENRLYIFLLLLPSLWKKAPIPLIKLKSKRRLLTTESLTFQVGFKDLLGKSSHMHFPVSFRSNSLAERGPRGFQRGIRSLLGASKQACLHLSISGCFF